MVMPMMYAHVCNPSYNLGLFPKEGIKDKGYAPSWSVALVLLSRGEKAIA